MSGRVFTFRCAVLVTVGLFAASLPCPADTPSASSADWSDAIAAAQGIYRNIYNLIRVVLLIIAAFEIVPHIKDMMNGEREAVKHVFIWVLAIALAYAALSGVYNLVVSNNVS